MLLSSSALNFALPFPFNMLWPQEEGAGIVASHGLFALGGTYECKVNCYRFHVARGQCGPSHD
jgi:hypothetical protein